MLLKARKNIKILSILAKHNSIPIRTSYMNLWKFCPEFRELNDIKGNSNDPNGVMIAVLVVSSGLMGICVNALTRLMTEIMV